MLPIFADVTADHRELIVMAGGGPALDAERYRAAKHLEALTPLFKPSNPGGALVAPLTWPTVLQLQSTFTDFFAGWTMGPGLRAWLGDQLARRGQDFDAVMKSNGLAYTPPTGLSPYPWQVSGAAMIAATGRTLITDEPRTGKTATTILGLMELAARHGLGEITAAFGGPVVVVCPASVIDPWLENWAAWAPHVKAVAWRGAKRRALLGTADVYVTSYETARIDAPVAGTKEMRPLLELRPAAVVIDECFPAETLISTPTGPRRIDDLRVGDEVVGIDHWTGEPVVTMVQHTFSRDTTEDLTTVNGVEMTPNHPVWTARGYVRADAVSSSDEVCRTLINSLHGDLHADLRVVRARVHEAGQGQSAAEVLQPGVLGEVAHVRRGVRRLTRHLEASSCCGGEHAPLAGEPGGSGSAPGAPGGAEQPPARSRCAGQGAGHVAGAGLQDAERWEWSADGAAEAVSSPSRLGHRGVDPDRAEGALPVRLQGGRGLPGADDRGRGGRREPQELEGPRGGRQAGRAVDRAGLDRAQVLEPAGARGDRSGDGADHGGRRVFNIETGTGNYVAGGLLVHNCHLVKNARAERTKAVERIAKRATDQNGAVVALSGTPITRDPGDLHPVLKMLEPGAYPSKERWVTRYCNIVQTDYEDENLGLLPSREPEFRMSLLGQTRRVARADVMSHLPPKTYTVRTVELPKAWRKVYDDFEGQMLAELPDGEELSVFDAMSVFSHLSSLASAPADVEVTFGPDLDQHTGLPKRHVHLHLKHAEKQPSWKIAELLQVMSERPGERVVVYAPRAQLVQLAGEALADKGYRVGYIVGGQSQAERTAARLAFQAGELDVVCATTGAGGVGITLSAAETLVFLQRPWALVESIQAEDRAEGDPNATRGTEVIDIVAANTIESRVRTVLRQRAGQLADLVQDQRLVRSLLGGAEVERRSAPPRLSGTDRMVQNEPADAARDASPVDLSRSAAPGADTPGVNPSAYPTEAAS